MATTQIATEYLIILSTESGEEADRKSCMAGSVEQAMENANYAADCLIETWGLYCAWTVYECKTGREMASWLPEGYKRPTI